ncbi:hypothetical protein [Reichenbachiella ulvae]|uniref:Uncharacterized protein n=1 Tax=Reichenbachiella ulvae TaxID=2980104 RepID=A0ABT3CVY5_9BACT|nr:hypothetical protein [Reichenbachiella ulvae]MCV9387757.1 hypothetical protein [Reichenbachiella ulvae]
MTNHFKIEQRDNKLTVSISNIGATKNLLLLLLSVLFVVFVIFNFTYEKVIAFNQYLVLIYLLPLLMIPKLIKEMKNLLMREYFHFDRSLNELWLNETRMAHLDDIEAVEINYKINTDSDDGFLELKTSKNGKIRISDSGSKKSQIQAGVAIAKFLKIELYDNFPYGKEILWGKSNVSASEIDQVNGA